MIKDYCDYRKLSFISHRTGNFPRPTNVFFFFMDPRAMRRISLTTVDLQHIHHTDLLHHHHHSATVCRLTRSEPAFGRLTSRLAHRERRHIVYYTSNARDGVGVVCAVCVCMEA